MTNSQARETGRGGPPPPSDHHSAKSSLETEMNDSYQLTQLDGNVSLTCDSTILQLDGNCSMLSDVVTTNTGQAIPVQIGFRPIHTQLNRRLTCRKTIRRDNRNIEALSLPKTLNFNMRSIWSKVLNVSQDIHEREGDLIFLTEVWEKLENKKHQYKIQEMLEMHGIKYISTPRPGPKRGGGAAIAVRLENFSI